MNEKWIRIDILCGGEIADDLAAQVSDAFGKSVEITNEGVRFYLEHGSQPGDWEKRLTDVLEDFLKWAPEDAKVSYRYSSIPEEDWADRWKANFKPLRVGRHFLVVPTWEKAITRSGDNVILMDPGRAFGTGHHETTRLCLEWLEHWVAGQTDLRGSSVLDVGCGTGILAIGAALLGIEHVVGLDNDPEAIEVARENLELNRLEGRIELVNGALDRIEPDAGFDAVLANIQALPLKGMARGLAGRVKGGGKLALSGILIEQQTDVLMAYEAQGMALSRSESAGEWCLLELESRGKG
jgi:ribosomal protein L11 methyltransferase